MTRQKQRRTDRGLGIELLLEAFVGTYVLAVVVTCWGKPVWISLLLVGILGMQVWLWGEKADTAAMIAAALLGTSSEMLCVKLGVWTYNAPGIVAGLPVWIPLVWASLFCLFRRISMTMAAVTRTMWPDPKMMTRKILFRLLGGLIVVYYLMTVFIIRKIFSALYTVFMIPAVIFWREERDILIFLIGGAFGTLGEYICMKLGFWQYHYPFLRSIGMPVSLPLAWGLSSVIIARIAWIWETGKEEGSLNG